jgi:hypothetical protein
MEDRMQRITLTVVLLAAVASAAGGAGPLDLATLDVCALVPGAEVAQVVAATPQETKRYNSPDGDIARCVYIVAKPDDGGSTARAFAVELELPSNFAEVRPYVEEPTRDVEDLGDGAWTSIDPDTGRTRLWVLRSGIATLYLTGDDEGELQLIADLVLSKL